MHPSFNTDCCCSVLPGFCSTTIQWEKDVLTLCAWAVSKTSVICNQKLQESYLLLGHCMTYNSSYSDEQGSEAISFGACPYAYYGSIIFSMDT